MSIKKFLITAIVFSLFIGCGSKDKGNSRNDEIEILKQRIEQHYKDGNYALAEQEIKKVLAATSTRSQRDIDEKIEKEFMELLEKIHAKMREEQRKEERAEEDDRDREVPTEESEDVKD